MMLHLVEARRSTRTASELHLWNASLPLASVRIPYLWTYEHVDMALDMAHLALEQQQGTVKITCKCMCSH